MTIAFCRSLDYSVFEKVVQPREAEKPSFLSRLTSTSLHFPHSEELLREPFLIAQLDYAASDATLFRMLCTVYCVHYCSSYTLIFSIIIVYVILYCRGLRASEKAHAYPPQANTGTPLASRDLTRERT